MKTRSALFLQIGIARRWRLPLFALTIFASLTAFNSLQRVNAGFARANKASLSRPAANLPATNFSSVRLNAADGAAGDKFGSSVAVNGDTLFVGAYTDDVGVNTDQGSVAVFTRNGATWSQTQQLFAADGEAGDGFGISLATDGTTLLVGAAANDNLDHEAGAVYVFTRSSGGAWMQQAKLTADEAATGDLFGFAVALDGDTAVVGAPLADNGLFNLSQGAAYVFTRGSGGVWTQQARLSAANGAAEDSFGASVAVRGDNALVGAPFHDTNGNFNQGAVYAFSGNGGAWTPTQELNAADGAANDRFGIALSYDGTTAVIGANGKDLNLDADQGAAYIYLRSGTSFAQTQRLTADDGAAGDEFGSAVGVSANTVIVGASDDDVNSNVNQGSLSVFENAAGSFIQTRTLSGESGAAHDAFGLAVAIDADTIIAGALTADVSANLQQGAAYIYSTTSGATPTPTPTPTATPTPSVVQFSQAAYIAAESSADGQPRVILTVRRSGGEPPLSGVITVFFSTTDGTARQRTDYTLAAGTLTFQPNETTKQIVISLIADGYAEGDESFGVQLSNAQGAQLGANEMATVTIADDDTANSAANPVEDSRIFARQQYLDFLAREPDPGGWNYWTGQISACGTADAPCLARRRVEVSAQFFIELEFQESGAFVYRLYKSAFGAAAEYRPTYAQFAPDRARVVGGSNLAQGKLDFAAQFVARGEFTARYPATLTPTEFTDALLAVVQQGAGVSFTATERQSFINDAESGGRGLLLRNLADAAAFRTAVYNRAFVLMQYFGYLRRDPDAGGYNYWLGVVQSQGDYRVMVCNFVTAREYQERFGAQSPRSNQECSAP